MSDIKWNANGLAMIEQHEREAIERGDAATCRLGGLHIDAHDTLWLDSEDGARIVGSVMEGPGMPSWPDSDGDGQPDKPDEPIPPDNA